MRMSVPQIANRILVLNGAHVSEGTTCTRRSDSVLDCSADDCLTPYKRRDLVGLFRKILTSYFHPPNVK
jgi:hypothetical protein